MIIEEITEALKSQGKYLEHNHLTLISSADKKFNYVEYLTHKVLITEKLENCDGIPKELRIEAATSAESMKSIETISEQEIVGVFDIHTQTCSICSGEKLIVCSSCMGKGRDRCPACAERGRVLCETCYGSGFVKNKDDYLVCPYCRGAKELKCYDCSGTGQKTCSDCNGNGKNSCSNCRGTGCHSIYKKKQFIFRNQINKTDKISILPADFNSDEIITNKKYWNIIKKNPQPVNQEYSQHVNSSLSTNEISKWVKEININLVEAKISFLNNEYIVFFEPKEKLAIIEQKLTSELQVFKEKQDEINRKLLERIRIKKFLPADIIWGISAIVAFSFNIVGFKFTETNMIASLVIIALFCIPALLGTLLFDRYNISESIIAYPIIYIISITIGFLTPTLPDFNFFTILLVACYGIHVGIIFKAAKRYQVIELQFKEIQNSHDILNIVPSDVSLEKGHLLLKITSNMLHQLFGGGRYVRDRQNALRSFKRFSQYSQNLTFTTNEWKELSQAMYRCPPMIPKLEYYGKKDAPTLKELQKSLTCIINNFSKLSVQYSFESDIDKDELIGRMKVEIETTIAYVLRNEKPSDDPEIEI